MENLTMSKIGGDWVVGVKKRVKNVDYLDDPRLYLFNGTQHGFMNLPGNPKSIQLSGAYFYYPIEGEVANLYRDQVSKIKRAAPSVLMPN